MVEVEFPDGSVRQVPSRSTTVRARRSGGSGAGPQPGPSVTFREPVVDPDWRYRPLGGGRWLAQPRGPC